MAERTDSFGYWLKRRRKALDLTQAELARGVSCSAFAIRKIEAGERRPSRRLAERLAERLALPKEERPAFIEAARATRSAARLVIDRGSLQDRGSPQASALAYAAAEIAPLVGRAVEFGELQSLLARLAAGSGHVVVVEGEPGIGKSRLLRELGRHAAARGIKTLATRCFEIERATPYQAIIDLVTQALALASAGTLEHLPPVALAELAALVPEAARRVPVPAPLSTDFPEARQARLYRGIAQLLDAVAASGELVVLVDDAQWLDDASAQCLHYLARHAASRPLLVLLALRADEIASDERLARWVESLRREPHSRHMALAGLELDDVATLLAGDRALAEKLQRETDGNPFFLTTMLQALRAGEVSEAGAGVMPLPAALRAFVRARLAHVPADARAALDAASVLGRRFDFETLVDLSGHAGDELALSLETLVRRGLLREEADGRYDFSHDKIREVAYLELGGARRMLLHRAAAESIARRAPAGSHERAASLAEHYERGQVLDRALEHMLDAAAASGRLFALRDALHWLDRAIVLAEARPVALGSRSLVDLHAERGRLRAQAGQTAGAAADMRHVLAAARASGGGTCNALIELGMIYRRADDYVSAMECLTAALAECRARGDDRGSANTLYHLGTVCWSDGRNVEAIAYHEEAVAICDRLGFTDLTAVQAYHGRGEAHYNSLEPRAAIACYERSIELARGIGDKSYEAENLMMIGFACTGEAGLGDYARATAKFAAALEIAQRSDLQWHLGPTLLGRDHAEACTGAYGKAYESIMETRAWLESLGSVRYQLMAYYFLGQLLLDLGLAARALEQLEWARALARTGGITFWVPRIAASAAIARLRLGERGSGAALVQEAAQCRAKQERMQLARCLEGLAEFALARGDARACLDHVEALAELAGDELVERNASTAYWRAAGLAALGEREAATAALEFAASGARRAGRVQLIRDVERARASLGLPNEAERWHTTLRGSVAGTELGAMLTLG